MSGTPYDSLVVFILAIDKVVAAYLLSVNALLSFGIVALGARKFARPTQVLIGIGFFLILMALTAAAFHFVVGRPVMRFETITFP
jgi:hypothetical protein